MATSRSLIFKRLRDQKVKEGENTDRNCTSEECSSGSMLDYDRRVSARLAVAYSESASMGGLRPSLKVVEWTMHGVPWIVGIVLGLLIVQTHKSIQLLVNLLVAMFVDLVMVGVLKTIIQRPRPIYDQGDMIGNAPYVDQFSFPSGHTSRSAMIATIMVGLGGGEMDMWPWTLVLVYPAIVGLSRIMMGRHYLSDVVGGLLLGWVEGKCILLFWLSPDVAQRSVDAVKNLSFF